MRLAVTTMCCTPLPITLVDTGSSQAVRIQVLLGKWIFSVRYFQNVVYSCCFLQSCGECANKLDQGTLLYCCTVLMMFQHKVIIY